MTNTWKHQLPNCEDTLTIALLTSVMHVATELLQDRALLLPQVCQTHSSENSFEPLQTELQTSKLHRGEQKVIKQAATIINNLILEEVRRLAGKDKETDLKRLNIDSLISEINPLLWEFVTSITRPAYQQKSSSSETDSTAHIKCDDSTSSAC